MGAENTVTAETNACLHCAAEGAAAALNLVDL